MAGYQIDTTPPKIIELFPPIEELFCVATNIFLQSRKWSICKLISEERSYGSPFLGLQLLQKKEVWTVYRNLYTVVGEKSIWSGNVISFDRECLTLPYSWSNSSLFVYTMIMKMNQILNYIFMDCYGLL